MSEPPLPPPDERTTELFVGLVMLIRELALSLLAQGQAAEARGLIDGVGALQRKTQGNLSPEESRFVEGVLFELRLAAVKGPAGGAEGAAGGTTTGDAAAKEASAEESSTGEASTGESGTGEAAAGKAGQDPGRDAGASPEKSA